MPTTDSNRSLAVKMEGTRVESGWTGYDDVRDFEGIVSDVSEERKVPSRQ
jgi:hypothetical protein